MFNLSNLFRKKRAFLPIYYKITEDIMKGKLLTPQGDKYSRQTGYNYKTGAYRFRLWEKEKGIIYLEDISPAWVEQFVIFQMEKGYCKNSISAVNARLKAVLRRLYNAGKSKYDGRGIVSPNESVTTVYSTIEDVTKLLNFDFTDTPGLDRVRDIYILQCFLGLRYSDLSTVLSNPLQFIRKIGSSLYIEIKTKKTGETVVIPVAKVVKYLLEKYEYNFGKVFSYQYYNLSIKDIAQRAGITDEIVFTRTQGGRRTDTVHEKWTLMSSHTARRTFATNAFLSGLAEKNIMLITGHRTTQAFHRYIRCSGLDAAIKIANHDFFSIELPATIVLAEAKKNNNLPG